MKDFLDRHNHRILGVINGFDRMRFRGSLREMAYAMGMFRYLWNIQVKLKDFKEHALSVSDKIKQATERIANAAGRQMVYLPTYKTSKEDVALKIAKEEQITEGLICVIRCVESCHSFYVQGRRDTKHLHMKRGTRKCLHYYFYLFHRRFGFMHLRLQTWFPFTIWMCMNGREWLARAMDKAGIVYLRRDNCFTHIDNIPAAQRLADKQGTVLRIETTINHPNDMKVYRPKEGDPNGKKDWRPMRKGVADVFRRAQISQAANGRYLNALAAVHDDQSLGTLTKKLCRPVKWKGKRERGLNPLSTDDHNLLKAISGGEFMINGFRNKDIRQILFGSRRLPETEAKKQSAKVTRKFRLLRAHGLIRKVSKTHRYMVTDTGRLAITALIAAQGADTKKLTAAA